MVNKKIFVMLLYMFTFNLLLISINESNLFTSNELTTTNKLNAEAFNNSTKEILSLDEIENTDEADSSIGFFEISGLFASSLKILVLSVAAIPLVGFFMAAYGIPLTICTIFQSLNMLLIGITVMEFISNRRMSQ